MLRTDTWVVETSGDRVRLDDLPMSGLEKVRAYTVENTWDTAGEGGAVSLSIHTFACSLHANKSDVLVLDKVVERPDGITASSNASYDSLRKFSSCSQHLGLDLLADELLEVSHKRRERVWPDSGTDQVVCVREVGDPVTQGLVDRVFEGVRT